MTKQQVVHTYNEILFSFKEEINSAICSNMDALCIRLSEISQTQKAKDFMILPLWGI